LLTPHQHREQHRLETTNASPRLWNTVKCIAVFSVLQASLLLQAADTATSGATIRGTVTYQPDPERRWRYSRYYIADTKTGALSESVVALRVPRTTKKPAAPRVHTHKIDQIDFQFAPETSVMRLTDKIRFTNSDNRLHNIRTNDGLRPFNFNLNADNEHIQTFARAGGTRKPIRIGCALHGGMRAWIYVFDHPWYFLTQEKGTYVLNHVPAGEYELRAVHPAGDLTWKKKITVRATDKLQIDIRLSPDHLKEYKK